jgi:hypothetical protein
MDFTLSELKRDMLELGRGFEIGEGTNEIQRLVIARALGC